MKWLFLIVLLLTSGVSRATEQNKEACLQMLRQIMKNCSMRYTASCIYPDGTALDINGRVAMKNNLFYDSSNIRTVIMDRKWYVNADHTNGYIAMVDLTGLSKKEIDNIGNNKNRFLIDDDYFKKNVTVRVSKEDAENLWVSLKFPDTKMVEKLVIRFSRKGFMPQEYQAVMQVPADASGEVFAKVNIHATSFTTDPDESVFDHTRIIAPGNKEIALKKFRNYKKIVYTSKKR